MEKKNFFPTPTASTVGNQRQLPELQELMARRTLAEEPEQTSREISGRATAELQGIITRGRQATDQRPNQIFVSDVEQLSERDLLAISWQQRQLQEIIELQKSLSFPESIAILHHLKQ